MTPDELFTRMHRQRADLAAMELAMDALMTALPSDARSRWLGALQALQAKRTAFLSGQGQDPVAIQQSNAAIDRRLARLRQASTEGHRG